ncbi:monooxygenase [Sorangium cellulosum]|uniref:Monooxygenase n=1 Tax=Sorangium cellulosum TaxID=56 RepID=A0A2L0EKS2_SORCE|nr:bifunctional 3-(3-hydroxy-phenyl)propionate/3-hydroxycinnamic acid hydroxylase [Sorangium cellulosum]AUX39889.1 monooxygenase [Sorangium cellulosum]
MNERVDVIVVGAGPVGMTATNLLGQYGIRALLLERDATLTTYPRATNLDDEALRTFQMFGLAQKQLDGMLPDPSLSVYSGSGELVAELSMAGPKTLGFPRLCTMLQTSLERTLREGLGRFGCVELRAGHTATGLSQSDDQAVVTVQGPGGESYRVEADFVLGCDGGRSIVRKLCNISMNGSSSEERWMLIEARGEVRPAGCFSFFGDPRRPLVFVQQPEGFQRWSIRLPPGEDAKAFEQLDRDGLQALFARWKDGPKLGEVRRIRTYAINTCVADRFRSGRVFLLGDSAHMMPPFAGQGLCSGLRDAANLCWKLSLVLRGLSSPDLLDSYEQERIPHVKESIAATERVGWLFFPRGRRHDLVRRAALRLLFGVPPLREQFKRRSKAMPRLRQGAFSARPPGGTMIAQPRVLRADGQRAMLDDVVGSGFAAIGMGVDPLETLDEPMRHFWARLGARTLKVLPAGQPPRAGAGSCEEVQDDSGLLARWFAEHRGQIALVRPDRFVAALFSRQEAPEGFRSLRGMLGA